MKYSIEMLEMEKKLSLKQQEEYQAAAITRVNELQEKDLCGASYQLIDNAYGNKVILKSGILYEELIPTVTTANNLEIVYDCAFGIPEEITKIGKVKLDTKKKKKGKRKRKPRNNTFGELVYFKERDYNGRYIAIGIRTKNNDWNGKSYDKYNTTHILAHIDEVDLPFFLSHRMRTNNGRLVTTTAGKIKDYVARVIMARMLTGEYDDKKLPKGLVVDHIDRNPLNNRSFNLRLVTPMENALNTAQIDQKIEKGTFYGLGIKKIEDIC